MKKYQIFVSSTQKDLIEIRRSVIGQIANIGHIPAAMELFGARNEKSWTLIKKIIEGSDYYVLIVGNRYGSIHVDTRLGFTEMEYDYAHSLGLPVIAILHKDRGSLPAKFQDNEEALVGFLEKVQERHQAAYWDVQTELPNLILAALANEIRDNPRAGWVRNTTGPTDVLMSQIRSALETRIKTRTYRENVEARVIYSVNPSDGSIRVSDNVSYILRDVQPDEQLDFWKFSPDELVGIERQSISVRGYAENGARLSEPVELFAFDGSHKSPAQWSLREKLPAFEGFDDYRVELVSEYVQKTGQFSSWEMPLVTRQFSLILMFPADQLRVSMWKVYDPISGDEHKPDVRAGLFSLKLFGWVLPECGIAWQMERI